MFFQELKATSIIIVLCEEKLVIGVFITRQTFTSDFMPEVNDVSASKKKLIPKVIENCLKIS